MTATDALLALAAVAFILYRQIRPQPVRSQSSARLAVILGAIGVYEMVQAADKVSSNATATAVAVTAGGLVIAAALGALRATTVKLWWGDDDAVWQRGTAVTVAIWLVALAAHVVLDLAVSGVSGADKVTSAGILLYVAVSLGLQRELVRLRARHFASASHYEVAR